MTTLLLTIGFGSVGAIFSYFTYHTYNQVRHKYVRMNQIEHLKSIRQVVTYIQSIARKKPTDDLLEYLIDTIMDKPLSDECLQRISDLHKKYADGLGRESFAINLLWSAILFCQLNN